MFQIQIIPLSNASSLAAGEIMFNPNWHEAGHFPPPCPFWIRFCQLKFYKKFPNFLEVKIDVNRVNLTPCWAHWVLLKMPLGGAKDEHVSCFHSSCQWGLSKLPKWTNLKWISLESYKWGYIFSFSWRGQPLPYVIYGTTWRYWGYPWQCRRTENWMTLLKAICSKTSYLWILQKFRCIWRKNSNSMHELKVR